MYPASQSVQLTDPSKLYVPGEHGVGVASGTGQAKPREHMKQEAELPGE